MLFRQLSCLSLAILAIASRAFAQMPAGHVHMSMPSTPLGIDRSRDGSGTSWLPDASPMPGLMVQRRGWDLMLHGNVFVEFTKTGGARGDRQFGSINWLMGMAERNAAGGQLTLRSMISLEPLTVGRCGYPNLGQTGEVCRGAALHDRQHPHDLFMELAADYRRALNDRIALQLYGGVSGEPALGPTAFPHRVSAMPNPIAPIAHHWLDSTHVSFGVVTAGLYGRKWKAEGSIFNGREPDDARYGFDLGRLDSYSGRFWFLPSREWAIQVSAGHLRAAEIQASGAREDVNRLTASATWHREMSGHLWATTIAWGRNRETGHATSAFLAETSSELTPRDTLFGRVEVVGKTATELAVPLAPDTTFTVTKLQLGYQRWLLARGGVRAGVGGSAGVAILPSALTTSYGRRSPGEFSVFFVIQPH